MLYNLVIWFLTVNLRCVSSDLITYKAVDRISLSVFPWSQSYNLSLHEDTLLLVILVSYCTVYTVALDQLTTIY